MAVRNIVKIDEEKCNGCGQCVTACAEGAIKIIDGKAKLVSETYCDGLGACLGHCPQDAISIEQREAPEFDEEATKAYLAEEGKADVPFACPGLAMHQFDVAKEKEQGDAAPAEAVPSQLSHWPVQLRLVASTSSYFADADLLLVADCVPVAMADFHQRFLKGRSVAMGCPKLDDAQILRREARRYPPCQYHPLSDRGAHAGAMLLGTDSGRATGALAGRQRPPRRGRNHRVAWRSLTQRAPARAARSGKVSPNVDTRTRNKFREKRV